MHKKQLELTGILKVRLDLNCMASKHMAFHMMGRMFGSIEKNWWNFILFFEL